jgi:hypothetical protein
MSLKLTLCVLIEAAEMSLARVCSVCEKDIGEENYFTIIDFENESITVSHL